MSRNTEFVIARGLRRLYPHRSWTKVVVMQVVQASSRLLMCCLMLLTASTVLRAGESSAKFAGLGLEEKWHGQAVLNTARDNVRHVVNDEDIVVVQSTAGVVTAFNSEDGRKRWAVQVGRNDEPAMAAVTNSEQIVIIAGPVVYGLNKFSGDELFKYRLPGQPSASPAIDDTTMYIPMNEGSVYAVSIPTLKHLERYGTLPPTIARPFLWRFICNEVCVHPPVLSDGAITFATESRNLHSIDLNGRSLYQIVMRQPATAPLTVVPNELTSSVIVATGDNRLRSVVSTKPEADWVFPMGRTIYRHPVVIGDHIFVVTDGGGLICVSRTTGRPVIFEDEEGNAREWYTDDITNVVSVTNKHVYTVDVSDRLAVLKRSSGEVLAKTTIPEFEHRHRNVLTDRVYLVSNKGEIVCLREPAIEFAMYHQNPDRQPITPDVPDKEPQPEETAEGF